MCKVSGETPDYRKKVGSSHGISDQVTGKYVKVGNDIR